MNWNRNENSSAQTPGRDSRSRTPGGWVQPPRSDERLVPPPPPRPTGASLAVKKTLIRKQRLVTLEDGIVPKMPMSTQT